MTVRALSPNWSGRLFLWDGHGIYLGATHRTDLHAHHAIQISVALGSFLRVRSSPEGDWKRSKGVVIGSDEPHQLDGGGKPVALLYLEPESGFARALRDRLARRGVYELPSSTIQEIISCVNAWSGEHLHNAGLRCLAADVIRILGGCERPARELDGRVVRVLAYIRSSIEGRITLADCAAQAFLSPSRFAHLFRDTTGLPLRRYVLWVRLGVALEEALRGASLTESAHRAGFADSAHLTRTFRRMFGITPSALKPE